MTGGLLHRSVNRPIVCNVHSCIVQALFLYLDLALKRKCPSCHKPVEIWVLCVIVICTYWCYKKVPNDVSVNLLHFTTYMWMCEQFPICIERIGM